MAGIKLNNLDRGINGSVPYDEVSDGDAVPGSMNCLYCDGLIQTPDGYDEITANGLPLESGEEVLAVFKYTEQDRTEHVLAITKSKVYRRDVTSDTWVELEKGTGSVPTEWGLNSNVNYPVSWATMDSTDGALLDDIGPDTAYRHLLMSDGGQTSVKRWAGKYETERWPLEGGDGYHSAASACVSHYCRQIGVFLNHVFLLNPKEYDSNSVLRDTFSRIRWGMTGKLEAGTGGASPDTAYLYTNVGAGYRDLIDTGDQNEWAMQLGNQLIVYQKRTIWTGSGVDGSDDALSFDVTIKGLGLLSASLLASDGNRHFFIGSDNKLWVYYGGQQLELIEGRIGEELRNAIDNTQAYKCFMCFGANYRRLWIFVVGSGETFSVKAYGLDLLSRSWQVRDYSSLESGRGVTTANLIGAQSYMEGPSYQDALDDTTADDYDYYPSTPLVETPAVTTWSETVPASGIYNKMTGTGSKWNTAPNKVNVGDHVIITAGTNVVPGVYPVLSITSDLVMTLVDGAGDGVGAPSAVTYTIAPKVGYRYIDEIHEVLAKDMLVFGSNDGYIYQHGTDLVDDAGHTITSKHLTKVFDFDTPNEFKLWPGLFVKASGTSLKVSFRIGNFNTTATGWVDIVTQTLTSVLADYTFYIHQSAQAIQFKFESVADFKISKAFILQPELESVV